MDIQSLRTFQAVVEEGGILSASRQLNTVQSNVTARIKRLEEELGTALFYRQGRGLVLAPQGEVLLQYAHRILQLEQQAGQAVRNVGESAGALRIGAMETFAALRLPPLLKQVRQAHPGSICISVPIPRRRWSSRCCSASWIAPLSAVRCSIRTWWRRSCCRRSWC